MSNQSTDLRLGMQCGWVVGADGVWRECTPAQYTEEISRLRRELDAARHQLTQANYNLSALDGSKP